MPMKKKVEALEKMMVENHQEAVKVEIAQKANKQILI
jgi:hypothetical protein